MKGLRRLRRPALLLACAGLLIGAGVVGWIGAGQVWASLSEIGLPGFLLLCVATWAYQLVLAGAWAGLTPGGERRFFLFYWARLVRDAVNQSLPLTPLGGVAAGARVLAVHGVPATRATAAAAVDASVELFAQIAFSGIGAVLALEMLAGAAEADGVGTMFALALGILAAAAVAVAAGPRLGLRAIERFGARLHPAAAVGAAALKAEIDALYRRRPAVMLCFTLHLASWFLGAAWSMLALHMLGAAVDFRVVVALEALICASKVAAFVIPYGFGVQEGAYAVLAPLFGVAARTGVALSLLRRARDLALGLPIVALWQAGEARRLQRQT
ncbi:lysylphosphatidylglycerol synthase domain-containing protein [Caulobacter sp. 17J80-11]|uniref:lysylphosphatidylglycerol synthase domain-containing protein n=1 Tax=Caulobacter sp. 17J80-11 TaxID=2763502 RepID=UPI001653EC2C|nr:flippase-like domain-containing protein [Caulobacter sp. 17J80-11]